MVGSDVRIAIIKKEIDSLTKQVANLNIMINNKEEPVQRKFQRRSGLNLLILLQD